MTDATKSDGDVKEALNECPTLYVTNLPTSKINLQTQRRLLGMIFNFFGEVSEIRATKGKSKRGQAWISFESQEAATRALNERQGFNFFDKPLQLAYAKVKSDVLSKKDGTFVERPSKPEFAAGIKQPSRKRRRRGTASAYEDGARASESAGATQLNTVPSAILFVVGLAPTTTADTLTKHFSKFPNFREIRLVPGQKGMAFVEYGDENSSGAALVDSQNLVFDGQKALVSYAKK